ncbi:MAG: thermonuclease family protein [Acidimicrobiia bacterium]
MRPLSTLAVLAASTASAVAGSACADRASVTSAPLPPGSATVKAVVDGDTIVVEIGGADEHVRLIGIDTPETKDPRKPVQCFGVEASEHTTAMLPKGTIVRLERDAEPRDVYGRLLAYVYRQPDDLFVNASILLDGYAQVLSIAPNVAHADEFLALERQAREQNRGLWSACR